MLDLVIESRKSADREIDFRMRRHLTDLPHAVVREDCCDGQPNFPVHGDRLAAAMLVSGLADRYLRKALSVLGLYEPSQDVFDRNFTEVSSSHPVRAM